MMFRIKKEVMYFNSATRARVNLVSLQETEFAMNYSNIRFFPNTSVILPFLSLILLSSKPFTRDSGLNSMFPSFRTAATTSKMDCVSWSIKPTICMAFWKRGKNHETKIYIFNQIDHTCKIHHLYRTAQNINIFQTCMI